MQPRVAGGVLAIAIVAAGCGRSDRGFDELRELGGVYGVPNIDDDDGDSVRDFRDDAVAGENDRSNLDLSGVAKRMRGNDQLDLALSGDDVSRIRVWDGDQLLLSEDFPTLTLATDRVPESIQVEFGDYLDIGALTITHRRPERAVLGLVRTDEYKVFEEVTLELISSPLILNHHLQPAEASYVVEGDDQGYGSYSFDNLAMVDAMSDSLGNGLVFDDMSRFGFDVWVQDEFETATLTSPDSRIDVVIDSIRDRGLDDFPELLVADGPDAIVRTWGQGNYPQSQDSFGNLEVSPPVTVDGVTYPFGRIYWGEWEGIGLVPELGNFLESQVVQDPFTVDVSFLLVGHIDEFTTFLPDQTAPKGFRLIVTDTDLGFAFLENLPPDAGLSERYLRDHGYSSVAQMAGSAGLRALNEDYQRDYIEPGIETMKRELGLSDEDIIRVPGIFEEVNGPYSAALIPGTVNMLVTTHDDGTATAFLPDPFLRNDGVGQRQDPLIAEFERLLPADVEQVWVDNWDVYHIALGEVHCGTNTTRTPTAAWWEDARHLIVPDSTVASE